MATSDKRELLLKARVDDQASRPLRNIGDAADDTTDNLRDMNLGLKKLDEKTAEATKTIRDLRTEVGKTGDLELVKDITKQEQRLKALARQRKSLLGDAGDDAADGFAANFVQRIGPLLAKAPISPPLIAAGAAAGAALAPVITAGITGGVGVGVAGIGALIAAQDPAVQAAAADLKDTVGDELRGAAQPFVPELLKSLNKGKSAIRELRPELDGLFADSAKLVDPLVDGIIGGVRKAVPNLREIVRNAEPVVDVFGEHATSAVDAFTGALADMSQGSELGAQSLDGLLTSVEGTIAATGKMVGFANEAYGFLGPGLLPWIGAMGNAESESQKLSEAISAQKVNAFEVAEANRKAALSYDQLVEASRKVHDIALSAAEANIRYKDSLKSATDAADGHKRVSTAEESSLLSLARSTNTLTEGLERSGASTKQLTAHSNSTRAEFIRVATAMGYTSAQAKTLADKYLAVPKGVKTQFKAPGLSGVNTVAGELYNKVQLLDGRVVNVKFTTGYQGRAEAFKADGGPVRKGEPYIVGEKRPELFVPETNGTIMPRVPSTFATRTPAGTQTIRLVIEGTGVLKGLQKEIRIAGGVAQVFR